MKKTIIIIVVAILVFTSGCESILESEVWKDSPHVAVSNERPPEELTEVSNYNDVVAAMLDLITAHEEEGLFVVYNYDGDVQNDVDQVKSKILNEHPVGVYAVSDITVNVIRIVTYYEIGIRIEYRRTKEQVESMVSVSTLRYLRTELLRIMSQYREEAVFLTSLNVTENDIIEYSRDTYYQNPGSIVMMPVMVVETLQAGAGEKLFELRFSNVEKASILMQFAASLTRSVRQNALAAGGENDAEILLSLVSNLIGACVYDAGTARTISEHGVQNVAATAYGALVRGSAVGEGFAMAFKALCDELDFDCRVVLGYYNGMVHAWNIVSLYGDYYHVDAAMCALNGIETAFINNDADIGEEYSWDTENTVRCLGMLKYEDIVIPEIEEPEVEPGTETVIEIDIDTEETTGQPETAEGEPAEVTEQSA